MSKKVSPPAPGSVPADVASPPKRRPKVIGLGVIAVGLLTVLINTLVSSVLPTVRVDLTDEHLYSLSPAVGPFLRDLDEPIRVQLFISRGALTNLPVYRSYATRVEEFLTEMQRVSDGKLELTVLDAEPFSEAEDLARSIGLEQANTGQIGQTLTMGLLVANTVDQRQLIPFLDPTQESTLEYDLVSIISGLSQPKRPVVGLVSALPLAGKVDEKGRTRPDGLPYAAYMEIQRTFKPHTIDPLADELPDNLDVLVLAHPAGLSYNLLRAIDAYAHQGGKLVVFWDPRFESQPQSREGKGISVSVTSDVGYLLKAWGVGISADDIVTDPIYAQRIGTEGGGGSGAPMLTWLGMGDDAMSGETPITRALRFVMFATAGHITRLDSAPESLVITPLIQTSPEAGLVETITTGRFANPAALLRSHKPNGERYTLAARLTGKVARAYPGPPRDPDADLSTDPAEEPEPATEVVEDLPPAKDADIVLVADADVLADRFWIQETHLGPQPIADNGAFLTSAIEVLTGNPVLSNLRPRAASRRPFTRIEALQREAEAQYLSEVERLQTEVRSTEERLSELLQQAPSDGQTLAINAEQRAEIQTLQDQTFASRKALRDVQYQLSRNIDRLGQQLMLLNVAAWPALIALVLATGLAWRWKRSRALD